MNNPVTATIFYSDLLVNYAMLAGVLYSIAFPSRRIWPPPQKGSWQYVTTWALFFTAIALNAILAFRTWSSWCIPMEIRLFVGVPVSIIGGTLVTWGIATLGLTNTYGIRNGFIRSGPYRFTRNPQYLGDIILFMFIGLGLIVDSIYVTVPLLTLALAFLLAPLAEESWLQEQYGKTYEEEYRRNTPRFL